MTLRHLSFACTLLLAGCSLIKTSSSTAVPGAGSSSSPSSPSGESPASSADASGDTTDTNGNKVPNLIGLSIDDAKSKIKAHGFDGQIEVYDLSEFDKDCKPETVCSVQSTYWYLNQDHHMTLYKNKAITIAVPE